jgi:hypothetical protein
MESSSSHVIGLGEKSFTFKLRNIRSLKRLRYPIKTRPIELGGPETEDSHSQLDFSCDSLTRKP